MDQHVVDNRIDSAIQVSALLLRAAIYGVVGGFAGNYDCGQSILTGLLIGDLGASTLSLLWERRDHLAQLIAELAMIGIIYLWVRSDLVWPDDPAQRAIMGLAAFGVFTSRCGGSLLTRIGPSETGF